MSGDGRDRVQLLVDRYALAVSYGGLALALVAVSLDRRWLADPVGDGDTARERVRAAGLRPCG